MTVENMDLPQWAFEVLATPGGAAPLRRQGDVLLAPSGAPAGRVEQGVARFGLPDGDASIAFYQAVGGAHFHERAQVPLAMTTLDTPVYHGYLAQLRQGAEAGVVVDVGGGDGRNTWPWLQWGHPKVVVVDPVFAALARLRQRVAAQDPRWLSRLLLVEADARALPLAAAFADRALSIEALAYLNEDYCRGLGECARLLRPGGRLLVADRDYEGGLVMQMLYFGGLAGLLRAAGTRDIWDGRPEALVRSRAFTAAEIEAEARRAGLDVVFTGGISALSLLVSALHARKEIPGAEPGQREALAALLATLGRTGTFRRSHVVIARK